MAEETTRIQTSFEQIINMTPARLAQWLRTPESKSVGWAGTPGAESVGHRSGRRIVDILKKRKDRLTRADVQHMAKVVGYVHRHLAQRPEGDVTGTRWRFSLMNWGHDPKKD